MVRVQMEVKIKFRVRFQVKVRIRVKNQIKSEIRVKVKVKNWIKLGTVSTRVHWDWAEGRQGQGAP